MADMSWRDAILAVLSEAGEPLHYAEIAQRIVDAGLVTTAGATPANTVSARLSTALANEVVKVDRGTYRLRDAERLNRVERTSGASVSDTQQPPESAHAEDEQGFLNAFGMFWRRDEVDWDRAGKDLLGSQLKAAQPVNFAEQVGVYILYSGNRIVYVGRTTEPRLGVRLWEHTRDRLAGRWDVFSWFGVREVAPDGSLGPVPSGNFAVDMLVATMEALLIEGLEPPQNRRRGDGFNATEFIQVTDPRIEERREEQVIQRLLRRSR